MEKQKLISDQIRDFIKQSGKSRYEIAKLAGIQESGLSRFIHRQTGLTSQTIDRIGAVLGLKIIREEK